MTERPLLRHSSHKAARKLCWHVRRLVRSVFFFLQSSFFKRDNSTFKKTKKTAKNKRTCKESAFKGCLHRFWQAWHDSSHFYILSFWPQSCSSNQHVHVWLKLTSPPWFIIQNSSHDEAHQRPDVFGAVDAEIHSADICRHPYFKKMNVLFFLDLSAITPSCLPKLS